LSSAMMPLGYIRRFHTAFIFKENLRHGTDGRTDGRGAILNAAF